ncbi:hypothetical protein F7731_08600 [Cytobacillus depressus]|uniref:Uncharacterized protein n=1 Tax=Cytobacillus depressus TaxID=1602942 RepID=A0A6L3V897_9BACI|nr:hypothetical protein [Cytobacillus depressus]KAB2337644.1 hypothetical protein F7731_08600 [Cytobacillus depressus]
MGFRYDMQNKSTQAQAVVRQRDREEKIREEEYKKKNVEEIKCNRTVKNGDYEAVLFTKGNKNLLELRVSGSAIQNGPCGLIDEEITNWLCKTGSSFINQVKTFETLIITSNDVVNKELITSWKNLRKETQASE